MNVETVVCVLSTGLAVVLSFPTGVQPERLRRLPDAREHSGSDAPSKTAGRRVWFSGVASAGSALLLTADGTVLVLGLILLCATVAGLRLWAASRIRTRSREREARVVEACEQLASELRSGQPPPHAIAHCAELWPELKPVAVAASLGADVPAAFRRLAEAPGSGGLRDVASAWQVAHGTGSGLADAMTQVAGSARDAQSVRRLVDSELSSAQATARLVAVLPLFALLMGAGIGGDPWGFLLGSPVGLCCLALGLGLALLGLGWIERIAKSVVR